MDEPSAVVLELQAAGAAPPLRLCRGELAILNGAVARAVIDWATDWACPPAHAIRYLGRDWTAARNHDAVAWRGTIGVASARIGWLSNLNTAENVTLAQRHHTRRPEAEIVAEADRWARAFGLTEGLPKGRPADAGTEALWRAACVRAFIGRPNLIVLDRPTDEEDGANRGDAGLTLSGLFRPLRDAVAFARGRGAGVIWVTADPRVLDDPDLRPVLVESLATAGAAKMGTGII